ncbi:MAG: amino acid ABC transporter permease [Hyphomicrobiaceae bacterium]|jgi:polar amino acid transport system permease protein
MQRLTDRNHRPRLMEAFWDFLRSLNDAYGINLVQFYDDFERTRLLRGMWTTIKLAVICIGLSVIIGIIGAWLQGSRHRVLKAIVQGYIQFFRNTPPLVQMYFFYFALGPQMPRVVNEYGIAQPMLGSFEWAVISLSFFAGAFNVEIFRSGIEAVQKSTIEAAESLCFNRWQTYWYVILPLAVRFCLPALNNNLVNLAKTTTQAYAIAVPETLYVASQIWSDHINVFEMMITLLTFYLLLVGVIVWLMTRLERALAIPGFGR